MCIGLPWAIRGSHREHEGVTRSARTLVDIARPRARSSGSGARSVALRVGAAACQDATFTEHEERQDAAPQWDAAVDALVDAGAIPWVEILADERAPHGLSCVLLAPVSLGKGVLPAVAMSNLLIVVGHPGT